MKNYEATLITQVKGGNFELNLMVFIVFVAYSARVDCPIIVHWVCQQYLCVNIVLIYWAILV